MANVTILRDIQSRLSELETDQILELLRPMMTGLSVSTPIISAGTVLFRGRKVTASFNKDLGIRMADLSYPPAHVTGPGRVNRAKQPFFYCSTSQEVVYFELSGLAAGDEIVLSYWRSKDDLLVNNVGYTQFIFEKLGAKRTLPTWTENHNHRDITLPDEATLKAEMAPVISQDENRAIREALSETFMCEVGETEQASYKLTAAIAECHLENIANHSLQFSGLLYPTIRMMANGDNLALKPKYVDSHLEFFKAKHIRIDKKDGSTISFTIVDFAERVSDDGKLVWTGRSPVFLLPSGDTGTFKCVEGRDEDGDYLISADGKVCHWEVKDQRGNILKLQ